MATVFYLVNKVTPYLDLIFAIAPYLPDLTKPHCSLNELIQREPIFHRPELGTTRADFEQMTEGTFWEVGASGRRYSREYVLDEMEKRYANPEEDTWQTRDFHCLEIAAENYLVTYTLIQGTRITRRSTIWRQTPQGWKIVYHQGTVVENA